MLESKKGKGGDREQGRVPGRLHRVRSLASELLPHGATRAKQSILWALGLQNLRGLASTSSCEALCKGLCFSEEPAMGGLLSEDPLPRL